MTEWYEYPIVGDFAQVLGPPFTYPVNGEDIEVPFNTPVTAPFSGTVTKQYYDPGGGQVIIQADNPQDLRGIPYYWFAHLDQIQVTQGQKVEAGTQIGLSGGQNVGGQHPADAQHSSGPHVEFGEAKKNEIPYTLATITPDLNPDWILSLLKGARIPNRGIGGSSSSSLLTTGGGCNCNPPDTLVIIGGEQYCKHDNGNGTASYKSCQIGGGGSNALDTIIGNLSPWLSDPVRIIKVVFGTLLLGIAVFLLVNPGTGIASAIKTGVRKVGLR